MTSAFTEKNVASFWKPYFNRIARDPEINRLRPVVTTLLNDMDVSILMEHGQVDAVVRHLEKRRRSAEPAEKEAIDFILTHRRLLDCGALYDPPRIFRLLGTGTHLFGKAEFDPADKSFISARRFTFLWLPLVTLGAYRVIEEEKRRHRVISRVALEPFILARRKMSFRILIVLVVLALAGGFYTFQPEILATHNLPSALHVANGFEFPVSLEVGRESFQVEPFVSHTYPLEKDVFHLVAKDDKGKIIAEDDIDNTTGEAVFIYNVLGVAPIYSDVVTYKGDGRAGSRLEAQIGQRMIPADLVYDIFVDPPEKIRIPPWKDSLERRYLELAVDGWQTSVAALADPDVAWQVAKQVMLVDPQNEGVFRAARDVIAAMEPRKAVDEVRMFYSRNWDSINAQRLLMATVVRAVGRGEEALKGYQQMQMIDPTTALGQLLLYEAAGPIAGLETLKQAVEKYPHDFYLRLNLVRALFLQRDFKAAVEHCEKLDAEHPRGLRSTFEEHALALLGLGRAADAVALVAKVGDMPGFPVDWTFAVLYGRLASQVALASRPHPLDHYVAATWLARQKPAFAGAYFSAMAFGEQPGDDVLATLADDDERNLVRLIAAVGQNTTMSDVMAREVSAEALAKVDNVRLILLAGDLLRRHLQDDANSCLEALHLYGPWQEAVVAAITKDEKAPILQEMDLELQAALKLVSAWKAEVGSKEAKALLEEALAFDIAKGVVTTAASSVNASVAPPAGAGQDK